jgi:hypothetical protein
MDELMDSPEANPDSLIEALNDALSSTLNGLVVAALVLASVTDMGFLYDAYRGRSAITRTHSMRVESEERSFRNWTLCLHCSLDRRTRANARVVRPYIRIW